jgi:SAM-dependent methyltransferase
VNNPVTLAALQTPIEVAAAGLRPGDAHYMAYVGYPELYDVLGASQFALLFTLGLRSHHRLLDVGCGSLRAGRLFIPYLDPGHYFGIEPNDWLIREAIQNEIGQDLVNIKRPSFDYNANFNVDGFGTLFDFILAHSIFSHTGHDLTRLALRILAAQLDPNGGRIVATFVEGDAEYREPGWIYPLCARYRRRTIQAFAQSAGLHARRIPWYHPADQGWYIFSRDARLLPGQRMMRCLQGAMLGGQFRLSWDRRLRFAQRWSGFIPRVLKTPIKRLLRLP